MSLYLGNQKVTPSVVHKDNKLQQLIQGELTELTKEDFVGCEKIGKAVFYDNNSLLSVSVGDSVNSIEENAFYSCDNLTNVACGNVKDIGGRAFYYCKKIGAGVNVSSVENFGESCFYRASNIRFISGGWSPNLKMVGAAAFEYTSISDLTFPASLEYLGALAFSRWNYDGISGRKIVFLGQVPDLPNRVFDYVRTLDCRYCTKVPVLQSASSIDWYSGASSRQCIVPDNLYDEWINSTNWVSYTNVDFIKASEA